MADMDEYGHENDYDEEDQPVEGEMDNDEEEEDILDMEDEVPQQSDALLMKFCPQDSSMLYPQVGFDTVCMAIYGRVDL